MSGFDRAAISVVEPGHEAYEDLDVEVRPPSRHLTTQFYNEVAQAYNESEVGSILIVPLPKGVAYYNLRNVLGNRGIKVNVDYVLARQEADPDGTPIKRSERPAKIKKLTEIDARVIDRRSPVPED